jgi:hypothetical protein
MRFVFALIIIAGASDALAQNWYYFGKSYTVREPDAVTYRQGNRYWHSNGDRTIQRGNRYWNSNGERSLRVSPNTYIHSNGNWTRQRGNRYWHSNGDRTIRKGNFYYHYND